MTKEEILALTDQEALVKISDLMEEARMAFNLATEISSTKCLGQFGSICTGWERIGDEYGWMPSSYDC